MSEQGILRDPEAVHNGMNGVSADLPITNGSKIGQVLKGSEVRIPMPWGVVAGKSWGNPNGYPVLGLHGWMDNAGTFDKLAPLLSESLYFVAVELPGHGFSSHLPPGMNYFFVDYVLVVRRIAKFLKWNKFSIIGHSMGAGVGAFYASVFPQDIEQLVLLDLVKPLTGDQHGYAEKIRVAINAALALEDKLNPVPPTYDYFEALDRLRKATSNSLTEESAKILLLRGSRQVDEEKYCFTRDLRLRNPSLSRFSHDDSFDILNDIRCRILLLKAKEGPDFENTNIIEKVMEIYKRKASEFEFIEVGGNHFFHLNEPEESASHINRFFLKKKAGL